VPLPQSKKNSRRSRPEMKRSLLIPHIDRRIRASSRSVRCHNGMGAAFTHRRRARQRRGAAISAIDYEAFGKMPSTVPPTLDEMEKRWPSNLSGSCIASVPFV